ncbi:MAG: Succinate dehydrogenase cytochrome b558 subunit [Chlamydiia bacterium]|nr:Succinate dehydrogenase cytochrome b558 subunit [Chlamydiia bacterium]MCH9616298.1 Succinate dehydrogenase cytochrome b558 subunit [Chlamydiia bacterium]MCH9629716.1 Succinate dehydrogenase cytochrome b558 subunit [Chlamydiia bacterium]
MERVYVWRRIHSLLGLWLVLFLLEHLFSNSQAALLPEGNWSHFVRAVNFLHNLPYLHVIEVVLLGVPILFHMGLGFKYLLRSKANSHLTDGSKPSMARNPRNHAYTWQRITSWVLVVGIILHVGYMRFLHYPEKVVKDNKEVYLVDVKQTAGLPQLAKRLGINLYEDDGEVIAECPQFGIGTLLVVRDTFHSIFKSILYTIFVLAACFHAFNGLWTFMISWGVVLGIRSQKTAVNVCVAIMVLLAFLGLAAIWGTHWSFYS